MEPLHYLLWQAAVPEHRFACAGDTLVIWDKPLHQHYAIQDYFPAMRRMTRATVIGRRR
jgi:taurine dioxygenase